MHAAPWALALALAALSTPALAADIDDLTTATVDESTEQLVDRHARRRPQNKRAVRGQPHPSPRTRRPARPPARPARPAPARPAPRPASPPPRRARAAPVRTAPRGRVVVQRPVVVRRVSPVTGVFVYGPPPRYHQVYRGAPGPIAAQHMPIRRVDRHNSFALGIKGGSLLSGDNGSLYTDPGLGLMARYRPIETVGLQLDVTHHGSSFEERSQTQAAASLGLFAYPWSRVSPYVLGGATWNAQSVLEGDAAERDLLTGLHGGVGVQFGIGQRVGLEFEGRYIGYLGRDGNDPLGALQGTAGLSFQL